MLARPEQSRAGGCSAHATIATGTLELWSTVGRVGRLLTPLFPLPRKTGGQSRDESPVSATTIALPSEAEHTGADIEGANDELDELEARLGHIWKGVEPTDDAAVYGRVIGRSAVLEAVRATQNASGDSEAANVAGSSNESTEELTLLAEVACVRCGASVLVAAPQEGLLDAEGELQLQLDDLWSFTVPQSGVGRVSVTHFGAAGIHPLRVMPDSFYHDLLEFCGGWPGLSEPEPAS
jgi:hypothetical protein